MTHPARPEPVADLWSRFSADPRTSPMLRASDADRNVAVDVLNGAYEDGRLDGDEHAERLEKALSARTLGDLPGLLQDVVLAPRPAPPVERRQRIQGGAIGSWIGLAVLFNVIWVASWLLSGHAPYYYWPIWPMLGTAVPVVGAWLALSGPAGGWAAENRELRREYRQERRQERYRRGLGR